MPRSLQRTATCNCHFSSSNVIWIFLNFLQWHFDEMNLKRRCVDGRRGECDLKSFFLSTWAPDWVIRWMKGKWFAVHTVRIISWMSFSQVHFWTWRGRAGKGSRRSSEEVCKYLLTDDWLWRRRKEPAPGPHLHAPYLSDWRKMQQGKDHKVHLLTWKLAAVMACLGDESENDWDHSNMNGPLTNVEFHSFRTRSASFYYFYQENKN